MAKRTLKKSEPGSRAAPKELWMANAFRRWEPTKKWYTLPWAPLLLACASVNGTPMRGSADCRYVPSVEDCQMVADRIEDLCLRTCVLRQCRFGRAVCNEDIHVECVRRAEANGGREVGGFVWDTPQTCEMPQEEVNWCQIERSPPCQARIMVHELAHACGWRHGDAQGVPGDEGSVRCL